MIARPQCCGIRPNTLASRPRVFGILVMMLLVWPIASSAQDSHYWTHQYGTEADLLNGLIVGGADDLSSAYYNPGSVAVTNDATLIIATDAIDISEVRVKDGAGKGLDLRSFKSRTAPRMFAIRLSSTWQGENHLVFSTLTRSAFDFDVDARRIDDATTTKEQGYTFAGETETGYDMNEIWVGLTWARNTSKRTGVGITTFGAYRDQKGRTDIGTTFITQDGSSGSSARASSGFSFYNLRLLWKLGAAIELDALRLGITATTPSVSLFGTGTYRLGASTIEVSPPGGGTPTSSIAATYQDDLSSHYESPLSIAVGASYLFGNSRLHFTAELFDTVAQFDVLKPKEFVAQTGGELIQPQLTHSMDPVFNFGFGVEHDLQNDISLYGSFITDYSGRKSGDRASQISIAGWDIFHLSAGSKFSFNRMDFVLGSTFGFGDEKSEVLIDLSNVSPADDSLEKLAERTVSYRRLKLMLGFSFPI